MNGLIDFQCEVYESGYEIINYDEFENHGIEARSKDKFDILFFVKPIDPKSSKRIFNLTDYPGAYCELANCYSQFGLNEPIIKFANKYGLLTNPSIGEARHIWSACMERFYFSVDYLEQIKSGDLESLKSDFIIIEDDKFKFNNTDFGTDGTVYDHYIEIPTIGQTPPRSYSEATYHYICNIVNINLKDSLVTEIIVNKTNTGTDMNVRPKNLLSALSLQLANAVSRNLEFKQCAACSTFFKVKAKKRKNEKIYCSDRCRVRVGARKRREKEKAL